MNCPKVCMCQDIDSWKKHLEFEVGFQGREVLRMFKNVIQDFGVIIVTVDFYDLSYVSPLQPSFSRMTSHSSNSWK